MATLADLYDLCMKKNQLTKNRRDFIRNGAILSLGAAVLPGTLSWSPEALFSALNPDLPGKHPGLIVLGDRPINAETPPHLLDDKVTPNDKFFVRNNGIPPVAEKIDPNTWTLTIEGESAKQKKSYTLKDLKTKFQTHTYQLVLECAGNGRKEFNPPAHGNQWELGGVGCAAWTGVRLKDVLNDVGIKSDAVYIGYYGKDTHLNGSDEVVISRGVPMSKAMEDESLIAWSMNGVDIPHLNGYPLRVVFGGWPASCSGKWLSRIVIRNKVHDGPKMNGDSYRMPCRPIAPGAKVEDKDMCIIEKMPVKSIISYPKTGATLKKSQKLPIRGHAWAGDTTIEAVYWSIDFGATWKSSRLSPPANRNAWQHFEAEILFPAPGYYEVWARAVDAAGVSQPMLLPGWNPGGYLNNACHRVAVKVV